MEIADKFGDNRRTKIVENGMINILVFRCISRTFRSLMVIFSVVAQVELKEIDVIPNNPCIIVFSKKGYIKRMNTSTFSVQGLRGRGISGTRLKGNDSLEDLFFANDHDKLLFFTKEGHVHTLPAYSIPNASRTASGTPITQVCELNESSNYFFQR